MDDFIIITKLQKQIKEQYPNPISTNTHVRAVREWEESLPDDKKVVHKIDRDDYPSDMWLKDIIETDEVYPQCNYCVGGALELALGVKEEDRIDSEGGIFPSIYELAETIHRFFKIPYAYILDSYDYEIDECVTHGDTREVRDKHCITNKREEETAYDIARTITEFNDGENIEDAWKTVGRLYNTGE